MTANGGTLGKAWTMVLRVAGLAGVAYETLYEEVDRPWLFLVFLTMMGLAEAGRVLSLLGRNQAGDIQIDSIRVGSTGHTKHVPPAEPVPEAKDATP